MWDFAGENFANDTAMMDGGMTSLSPLFPLDGLSASGFEDWLEDAMRDSMGLPGWMNPYLVSLTGIPGDDGVLWFGAGGGSEGAGSNEDIIVWATSLPDRFADWNLDGSVPFSEADGDIFDEMAILTATLAFAALASGVTSPASPALALVSGFLFIMDGNPSWGRARNNGGEG